MIWVWKIEAVTLLVIVSFSSNISILEYKAIFTVVHVNVDLLWAISDVAESYVVAMRVSLSTNIASC